MYYTKNLPWANMSKDFEWSKDRGVRKTPQSLGELSNPYTKSKYSLDERVAMAAEFNREKQKEDYISSITGKPKSSSTSAAAPSSISDSYRTMGAGGMMGKLEGASLRLGQAESDRRIREKELEEERESKRRIGAGFNF